MDRIQEIVIRFPILISKIAPVPSPSSVSSFRKRTASCHSSCEASEKKPKIGLMRSEKIKKEEATRSLQNEALSSTRDLVNKYQHAKMLIALAHVSERYKDPSTSEALLHKQMCWLYQASKLLDSDESQNAVIDRRLKNIKIEAQKRAITLLQPEEVACQKIKAGRLHRIIKREVSQFFKENPADRNEVDKNEMIYLVSRYAYGLPSIDPICSSKK